MLCRYPFKALGRAQVIASNDFESEFPKKIWISIHPSIYKDVLCSFAQILNLNEVRLTDSEIKKESTNTCSSDFKKFINTPKFISSSITLSVLKDTLVKFRLIGPRSYNTIRDTLIPITVSSVDTQKDSMSEGDGFWWKDYYSDTSNMDTLTNQISLLNSFQNCESSSRKVCSFIIRDPRAILPVRKKSILQSEGNLK